MIAVAAISGAVLFSAFKAEGNVSTLQYWEYSGNNLATDQMEYQPASAPSCAAGSQVVCTILAEEDPNNPGFPLIAGTALESRIQNKDESNSDVFVRN